MAAARSKLVSNWRLPGWYCGGQSTSWAPRRAASRSVQAASARCGRASAHRSARPERSEEHTSELQSHSDLVCRLLLEKKKYDEKIVRASPSAGDLGRGQDRTAV